MTRRQPATLDRWLNCVALAQNGAMSRLEIELLLRARPATLGPREPLEIESIKGYRRRIVQERQFYGEMAGWLTFCGAGAEVLGREEVFRPEICAAALRLLELSEKAMKKYKQAACLIRVLDRYETPEFEAFELPTNEEFNG